MAEQWGCDTEIMSQYIRVKDLINYIEEKSDTTNGEYDMLQLLGDIEDGKIPFVAFGRGGTNDS